MFAHNAPIPQAFEPGEYNDMGVALPAAGTAVITVSGELVNILKCQFGRRVFAEPHHTKRARVP